MRAAKTTDTVIVDWRRRRQGGFAQAAHVAHVRPTAVPIRGMLPFAPNCALADVGPDGALVMSSTQDVYSRAQVLADSARHAARARCGCSITKAPARSAAAATRTPRKPPRSCRRRSASRCACSSCAGTSMAGTITARPISPRCAPAIDADGKIVAYEYHGWQHGWTVTSTIYDICAAEARRRSAPAAPARSRSTR